MSSIVLSYLLWLLWLQGLQRGLAGTLPGSLWLASSCDEGWGRSHGKKPSRRRNTHVALDSCSEERFEHGEMIEHGLMLKVSDGWRSPWHLLVWKGSKGINHVSRTWIFFGRSQALSSDINIEYKKSYSMIHLKRFIWKGRVREPFRR